MKPANLKTKIFLDSGDPAETREALLLLGFLDGQTTNPSLIAKNPATAGKKFSKNQLIDFYKGVVQEISALIPQGSVSIEVYADKNTSADEMLGQGRQFWQWIPNAHIKYPTIAEGLKAAETSVKEGMRVNMTLVFSQEQAAAVYSATKGTKKGDVFLSPFIGRLDDRGENGMDLIKNIIQMYHPPAGSSPAQALTPPLQGGEFPVSLLPGGRAREGVNDGHVEVLAASVRSMDHFMKSIELGADIITAPLKIIREWVDAGAPLQSLNPKSEIKNLKSIPYQEISLDRPWQEYNIQHELTDKGIEKFVADWNSLIK